MELTEEQLQSAISEAIERMDTLELLRRKAGLSGISEAAIGARAFLKLGSRAVVGSITKRKPIPRKWVESALKRQNGLCSVCERELQTFWAGREDYAVGDHLIALTQGGEHQRRNIVAMCAKDNGEKYNKSVMETSKRSGILITQLTRGLSEEE